MSNVNPPLINPPLMSGVMSIDDACRYAAVTYLLCMIQDVYNSGLESSCCNKSRSKTLEMSRARHGFHEGGQRNDFQDVSGKDSLG